MKYKFNHQVILKYAGQALVAGITTFIAVACIMLFVDVITNGAPNIPCDICY